MGNICCQTISDTDPLQKLQKVLQFHDYQVNQWPQDDQYLNQWAKKQDQQGLKNTTIRKKQSQNRYYIGDWNEENSKPNGKGIFYDPNLILYQGQFNNGSFNGDAKVNLLKRNCVYQGQIQQGKAKGKGSLINHLQKYQFKGDWDNSRPTNGIMKFDADPNVQAIQFLQPTKGIINYRDNRIYKGDIHQDNYRPDGFGKVQFPENSQKKEYQGEWIQGNIHGKGKYIMKDGSYYEGQYNYGKKDGLGIFVFTSGKIYEGQWKDGNQHGLGILSDQNGRILKRGRFQNTKFVQALQEESFLKQKSSIYPSLSNISQSKYQRINDSQEQNNERKQEERQDIASQKKLERQQQTPQNNQENKESMGENKQIDKDQRQQDKVEYQIKNEDTNRKSSQMVKNNNQENKYNEDRDSDKEKNNSNVKRDSEKKQENQKIQDEKKGQESKQIQTNKENKYNED